jgi:hypothetical protein
MAKRLPLAEKVYDPEHDETHYVANSFSGNVTLCGQTDWLAQKEPGLPTDAPVDCKACKSIVDYVQGHQFDEPGNTRYGKN